MITTLPVGDIPRPIARYKRELAISHSEMAEAPISERTFRG
jgi:hypothetical protein